jgi:hypothetical protein
VAAAVAQGQQTYQVLRAVQVAVVVAVMVVFLGLAVLALLVKAMRVELTAYLLLVMEQVVVAVHPRLAQQGQALRVATVVRGPHLLLQVQAFLMRVVVEVVLTIVELLEQVERAVAVRVQLAVQAQQELQIQAAVAVVVVMYRVVEQVVQVSSSSLTLALKEAQAVRLHRQVVTQSIPSQRLVHMSHNLTLQQVPLSIIMAQRGYQFKGYECLA